jgi:hypothetical protein
MGNARFYSYSTEGRRLRDWVAAIAAGEMVPNVECTECSRPGLQFSDFDVRLLERAIELISAPDAWLAQATSQPCVQQRTGPCSLTCAIQVAHCVGSDGQSADVGRGVRNPTWICGDVAGVQQPSRCDCTRNDRIAARGERSVAGIATSTVSGSIGPFDRLFGQSELGAKHSEIPEAGLESLIDERVLAFVGGAVVDASLVAPWSWEQCVRLHGRIAGSSLAGCQNGTRRTDALVAGRHCAANCAVVASANDESGQTGRNRDRDVFDRKP